MNYLIKLTTLMIFLNLFLNINGQKIILVEPHHEFMSKSPSIETFSLNGMKYYLFNSLNMAAPLRVDLQLEAYDAEGVLQHSFLIDKSMNPAEPNYFKCICPVGERLILFKYGYDMATKNTTIYAYELTNGGVKKEPIGLASIKSEGILNMGEFDLAISPDRKKVLVLSNLPRVKKMNEKMILTVFNENFEKINSKEIEIPYIGEKSVNNTPFINNQGFVFIKKVVDASKETPVKDIVFTFSPELALIKESRNEIGVDGVISTYKAKIDGAGDLVFGGMYYDYKKIGINSTDPDGVFISKCTKDGEISESFTSKKYLGSYITQQIEIDDLGNFYILTEFQNIARESVVTGNKSIDYYHFTHNNGKITKFTPDLKFAWEYEIGRAELKSTNDAGITNQIWMGLMDGNISILYRDAYYRHDGVQRTVVTYPVSAWFGNVVEVISTDGVRLSKDLVRDIRFGGSSGNYMWIPQTGFVNGKKINLLSLATGELVFTEVEK